MLSQVELGRPRGEVFPGYREAALPSSQQEGGGLEHTNAEAHGGGGWPVLVSRSGPGAGQISN